MHGYSSSEESEDPKRPKAAPSSSSTSNDQKKKKKKKPPPQATINRIWKKLQASQPTIPLAVLPFDPVQPPASPDRANESSAASYERAVEECRRKVRKIIKECRRVNTRYRDPGWDLDWDLKMEKGNCLNYLGHETYEVGYPPSSSANLPKAVKRVHEIFENPTFMKSVSSSEIVQGSIGNCWAVAALSALADVKDGIQQLCVEYDTRVGIYGFVFYRDGEWVYSIIDDKLYLKSPNWDCPSLQRQLLTQIDREDIELHYRKTYQTGSKALFFGKNKDQNETWLPLLEKAYAKAHGDYASLIGGWIGEGLEDMTGGVTTELLASDILDTDAFWDDELSKVNKEFMFGCSTGLLDGGYGSRDGITERHAYGVMDARTLKSGQRLVKLRNPWGKARKGVWEGAWGDGSKEWTTDVQQELGHQFGNDSVFWISYEDLLSKYQHFDRTRLFRENDWGCCQRWIGVDVPWKASYHEKFHIKLTKDSPLVLVLSQLDRRYFKGLEGQYNFRLQFRVHEQGHLGAEDYIVRSHGNYLMTRSVSIEIPDMPAGNYTVYILVTAERNTDKPSVDEVVKRECKKRVENEKLAQVGYAYDLAHSKAHHHIEKVREMRKTANQNKASGCRMSERRKQWERRRAERTIKRKQLDKNEAKKARLLAERDAAHRKTVEEHNEAEAQTSEDASSSSDDQEEQPAKAVVTKTEETVPAAAAQATPTEEKSTDNAEPAASKEEDQPSTDKPATFEAKKGEGSLGAAPSEPVLGDANNPDVADKSPARTVTEPKPEEPKKAEQPPATPAAPEPQAQPEKEKKEKKAKKVKKAKKTSVPKEPAPSPPAIDYSSDSPVEDWEAIYSSDDYIRKPRTQPIPETTEADRYPSEDESLPDAWNAVCIVGFKVFSRDSNLELRVVMEGGDMLEGGMGQKGEKDLDNAQANAAGEREETCNAFTTYNPIVVAGEDQKDPEAKSESKSAEQTEDEDGDDESEGDDEGPKKLKAKKKKTTKKSSSSEPEASEKAAEAQATDTKEGDVPVPAPVSTPKPETEVVVADEPVEPAQVDTPKDPETEAKVEEPAPEEPPVAESKDKSASDESGTKEEEMKLKEELMMKREAELKKREEEMRRMEEEMRKLAEEMRQRAEEMKEMKRTDERKKCENDQAKEEDDYVNCEDSSDTSSVGVRTPEPTPFDDLKNEILG